jgi:rod shape-determining protein MreD
MMRTLFLMSFSFLAAFLLEILPIPNWAIWFRPAFVLLILIFWTLISPNLIGIVVAFLLGLIMDLLMGTLLGTHATIFVMIIYVVLRFHMRIRLIPLWQQTIIIFGLVLCYQIFLSWCSGLLGGFRADSWFWLPALTSAVFWPWIYTILKTYSRYQNRRR